MKKFWFNLVAMTAVAFVSMAVYASDDKSDEKPEDLLKGCPYLADVKKIKSIEKKIQSVDMAKNQKATEALNKQLDKLKADLSKKNEKSIEGLKKNIEKAKAKMEGVSGEEKAKMQKKVDEKVAKLTEKISAYERWGNPDDECYNEPGTESKSGEPVKDPKSGEPRKVEKPGTEVQNKK